VEAEILLDALEAVAVPAGEGDDAVIEEIKADDAVRNLEACTPRS
jgi:hypothetical protein